MKKNYNLILSIGLLIMSSIFSYFGLKYIKSVENSYFKLSRINTNLVQELDDSKNQYKNLNQDYNSKNSRLDKINSELQKFDIITNESSEIEDLNNKLIDCVFNYQKNYFDNYYETNKYLKNKKSLNGIFIESNLDEDSIKSNILMLPFIINSPINSDLNQIIEKHNSKVYENLGILNYLKDGENYMIKSLLLNNSSEISSLIEEKRKVNSQILDYYSVYKNIYMVSNNSNLFLDSKGLDFNNKDNNRLDIKNPYNTINALSIEILNTSVNYLKDYDILENNSDLSLVDINNNTLMNQKLENKNIITTYFNNILGYDYNFIDELD